MSFPKQKRVGQKFELFLIRHGYSIANRFTSTPLRSEKSKSFFSSFEKIVEKYRGIVEKMLEPDPSLTRTGIEQSKKAASDIEQPHFIFTSVLCRAQQTALFMFPSIKQVIVAPYLKERNNPGDRLTSISDNKPFEDIFTQYEKRHNVLSGKELEKLFYSSQVLQTSAQIRQIQQQQQEEREQKQFVSIQVKEKSKCLYNKDAINENGNIQMFISDYLCDFLQNNQVQDKDVRIAVVCHGGIIRDFLRLNEHDDIFNNTVFKVSYDSFSDLKEGKFSNWRKVFHGFPPSKISCQSKHVEQNEDSRLSHFRYPYEEIIPKTYTMDQLKQIYINQFAYSKQQQPWMGSSQTRIKNLFNKIRQKQSIATTSQSLKKFKETYPRATTATDTQLEKFFQEHPQQLKKLIFELDDDFKRKIQKIKILHQLKSQQDTLKFINTKLAQQKSSDPRKVVDSLIKMASPPMSP